jgi:hypothetical protein
MWQQFAPRPARRGSPGEPCITGTASRRPVGTYSRSAGDDAAGRRDALAGRLIAAALGAVDLLNVYLGDRLGLYRALVEAGPVTSSELAARTGVHERYAREWLEQQAVTGLVDVDDVGAEAAQRR